MRFVIWKVISKNTMEECHEKKIHSAFHADGQSDPGKTCGQSEGY